MLCTRRCFPRARATDTRVVREQLGGRREYKQGIEGPNQGHTMRPIRWQANVFGHLEEDDEDRGHHSRDRNSCNAASEAGAATAMVCPWQARRSHPHWLLLQQVRSSRSRVCTTRLDRGWVWVVAEGVWEGWASDEEFASQEIPEVMAVLRQDLVVGTTISL